LLVAAIIIPLAHIFFQGLQINHSVVAFGTIVTAEPRGDEPRCAVPECHGISHADPTFREALWDRFFTAAPRPRTPSELLYSDRRLRSKSSPAATILIRKR